MFVVNIFYMCLYLNDCIVICMSQEYVCISQEWFAVLRCTYYMTCCVNGCSRCGNFYFTLCCDIILGHHLLRGQNPTIICRRIHALLPRLLVTLTVMEAGGAHSTRRDWTFTLPPEGLGFAIWTMIQWFNICWYCPQSIFTDKWAWRITPFTR